VSRGRVPRDAVWTAADSGSGARLVAARRPCA
jgi:hypothetical protein